MTTTLTPRPHCALIKARVDGETIQYFSDSRKNWTDILNNPFWGESILYRVKPKNQIRFGLLSTKTEKIYISNRVQSPTDNIKVTLNPEGNKILAVELL